MHHHSVTTIIKVNPEQLNPSLNPENHRWQCGEWVGDRLSHMKPGTLLPSSEKFPLLCLEAAQQGGGGTGDLSVVAACPDRPQFADRISADDQDQELPVGKENSIKTWAHVSKYHFIQNKLTFNLLLSIKRVTGFNLCSLKAGVVSVAGWSATELCLHVGTLYTSVPYWIIRVQVCVPLCPKQILQRK